MGLRGFGDVELRVGQKHGGLLHSVCVRQGNLLDHSGSGSAKENALAPMATSLSGGPEGAKASESALAGMAMIIATVMQISMARQGLLRTFHPTQARSVDSLARAEHLSWRRDEVKVEPGDMMPPSGSEAG
jgi:hypothetical protein